MSQENVEVVRKPLRVRERSSRTLDQRLLLRFPRLAVACLRLIGSLPPGSRLRQAALWRGIRLAVEAFNRRDLDAVLVGYHPDFEFQPPREGVEAGFAEPSYRGRAGYLKYVSELSEVWGADLRVEPAELIDLGDRLVTLGYAPGRGQASGVALTNEFAAVVTLKHGRVICEQDYMDHPDALAAVGLRE
jgi:ketosteroid isomerase-like protein